MAQIRVEAGWNITLSDLGVQAADVLTLAQLPKDLLNRPAAYLSVQEYLRFWNALITLADDPLAAMRLGQSVSVEEFSAPFFAALCSPNLHIALPRLAKFKRLVGPLALRVAADNDSSTATFLQQVDGLLMPASMIIGEMVFLISLARLATRKRLTPALVVTTFDLQPRAAYETFFGCPLQQGFSNQISFDADTMNMPFLTASESMWRFFEPELRQRLSDLDVDASFASRVKSALLQMLPAGQSTAGQVAESLAVSKRTLQRRLTAEATSFQLLLNQTREGLALHYLSSSTLSNGEVSLLLGFDDANSFLRAFHQWTGVTPKSFRQQ
jgi:AraC-like DNA-binding protein